MHHLIEKQQHALETLDPSGWPMSKHWQFLLNGYLKGNKATHIHRQANEINCSHSNDLTETKRQLNWSWGWKSTVNANIGQRSIRMTAKDNQTCPKFEVDDDVVCQIVPVSFNAMLIGHGITLIASKHIAIFNCRLRLIDKSSASKVTDRNGPKQCLVVEMCGSKREKSKRFLFVIRQFWL